MLPQLTFSEMSRLAWSLCTLADGESALARTALSWTFRNHLEARAELPSPRLLIEACTPVERGLGPADDGAPAMNTCDFRSPDFCMALSSLCVVWSGTQSDPTEGALSFHRHDQLPRWARTIEPCALIGSYFFYRRIVEPMFAPLMVGRPSGQASALSSNEACTLQLNAGR